MHPHAGNPTIQTQEEERSVQLLVTWSSLLGLDAVTGPVHSLICI